MVSTPEDAWALAERVCTPAEVAALRARERLRLLGQPHGHRSVARSLGISRAVVRDRLLRAEIKLTRALPEEAS